MRFVRSGDMITVPFRASDGITVPFRSGEVVLFRSGDVMRATFRSGDALPGEKATDSRAKLWFSPIVDFLRSSSVALPRRPFSGSEPT